MGWVLLIQLSPNGGVFVLAVRGSAESSLGGDLASLVERARASSPPQPELPWFTDGGAVVEPRPVAAASPTAPLERPRRSLREEREAREMLALVQVTQEARRLAQRLREARLAREARQLQQLVLLAAALRRAGFPR